jgi:SAM-dependent methyltransferase
MTTLTENGIEAQSTSQENQDSLPSHLGGHLNKTHTDRGTLLYLMEKYDIKSFLDIGCGPGGMVQIAKWRGLDAMGIDGDWEVRKEAEAKVFIHDYTNGPAGLEKASLRTAFDLGWSVEFLEHVDEQYLDNYMQDFARCKYVVCTAAGPGAPGHHHVNCQPAEYWHTVFDKYGFDYDDEITQEIRLRKSNMQKPFMQRTGMFFVRRS